MKFKKRAYWLTDIAAAESLDEVVKLVGIKEPALSRIG